MLPGNTVTVSSLPHSPRGMGPSSLLHRDQFVPLSYMSTQDTWFPGPPRTTSGAQQLGSADETSKWQAEMVGIHPALLCCAPMTGSGSFLYQQLLLMADLQAKISSDEPAGKCPWTKLYPSKTQNLCPLFKCWRRGWHNWWTGGGQT